MNSKPAAQMQNVAKTKSSHVSFGEAKLAAKEVKPNPREEEAGDHYECFEDF